MSRNHMEVHHERAELWKVTLIDTGETSMMGDRLKQVEKYIENEDVFFFTFGDGVRVVNIACGSLIKENALIESLKLWYVHFAALDVFEDVPLPMSSPLRDIPLCIFGSHNGSYTRDAVLFENSIQKKSLDKREILKLGCKIICFKEA